MKKEIGFLFIPPHIMAQADLTIQEKTVFGRIIGLTEEVGYCYASNSWLGEQIGLSDSMVSKYISKLVKKGFLRVEIQKVKKNERTGMIGEKYGTIRKIYAYQIGSMANPSTIDGEPPSTIDGEYSVQSKEKRGGGTLSHPTASQGNTTKSENTTGVGATPEPIAKPILKPNGTFDLDDLRITYFIPEFQINLLVRALQIFGAVNIPSLLDKGQKYSKKQDDESVLKKVFYFLLDDIIAGKYESALYSEGFRNNLPQSFKTVLILMGKYIKKTHEEQGSQNLAPYLKREYKI